MPRKYACPEDRIIANTILSDEQFHGGTPCWIWIGTRKINREGKAYGTISVRDKRGGHKKELVHRFVLREIKGRRLTRRSVGLHLCNNPLCCNPMHLTGGTQISNMRQAVREGRHGNAYRAPVNGQHCTEARAA